MLYQGTFKDRLNNQYTVQIVTSGDTSRTTEIVLGTPPFTTSMDSQGDTLYKTAKYQSATIKYVSKNEYYDMYSGKAQQNKVTLLDNSGNIAWVGYIEPNAYNQDYQGYETEVELNAIDALSTLQYFKYKPISSKKAVVTFADIINSLIAKCNAYDAWYISDNVKFTSASTASFVNNLYISEQNFFDDKREGETDDDVAWGMDEVLEEIAKFLNMTVIAWGNAVYFLDYDAIKQGVNDYWKYTVGSTTPTRIMLSSPKTILGEDIVDGSQTVSLGDVYNKVSIKADNYTFDTIIPSLYDNLENITSDHDEDLASSENANNGMYGEIISSPLGESEKKNENMIMMIDRVYIPQKKKYGDYNVVGVKYYKNPNYKLFRYDDGKYNTTVNYTDTKNLRGCVIAKFFVQKLENRPSDFENLIYSVIGKKMTLDEWMKKNEVSKVSFSNYVEMLNPEGSNHISSTNIGNYPFLQTDTSDTTSLFGGKNAYLLISGSYMYHYMHEDPYPIPDGEVDISEGRRKIKVEDAYVLAKLQWGKKYWNGSAWQTTPSTFKIAYLKDGDNTRADGTMFNELKFKNTVSWRLGIDKEGYCIKAPSDEVIEGQPIFTLYCPHDPYFNKDGQVYKHSRVFMKDFDIQAIISDPTFSGQLDTDTEYTNVIDNDYVNELKEITWKISTFDNKKPSYSAVAYKDDNSSFQFLDKTYSMATAEGELSWENSDTDAPQFGQLKQEEHMIYRLVNQYSQPSINLTFTIGTNGITPWSKIREKYMGNKDFIIDEFSIDYENASTELSLIEKK